MSDFSLWWRVIRIASSGLRFMGMVRWGRKQCMWTMLADSLMASLWMRKGICTFPATRPTIFIGLLLLGKNRFLLLIETPYWSIVPRIWLLVEMILTNFMWPTLAGRRSQGPKLAGRASRL